MCLCFFSSCFHLQVEEFNDQPNGICLECWKKTEEFDKFYKSVQAAHLILLSTKYKHTSVGVSGENVEVKDEKAEAGIDSSAVFDHTVERLASKPEEEEEDDSNQDTDVDHDNGKYICKV